MKPYALGGVAISAAVCIALHPWTIFAKTVTPDPAEGEQCDKPQAPTSAVRHAIPEDGSPALGPQTAKVTVVEFTDYDCPYCLRADKTMAALRAKYGSKLRWVVKQFPLPMHEHAHAAALAALAAQEQGKFFEMHQLLFGEKDHTSAGLDADAAKVGLDPKTFHAALEDPALAQTLKRDHDLAAQLGVEGVPSFFVNGKLIQGAQPAESFEKVIDAEL